MTHARQRPQGEVGDDRLHAVDIARRQRVRIGIENHKDFQAAELAELLGTGSCHEVIQGAAGLLGQGEQALRLAGAVYQDAAGRFEAGLLLARSQSRPGDQGDFRQLHRAWIRVYRAAMMRDQNVDFA